MRDQDQVAAGARGPSGAPEALAQQAACAIPRDRAPHALADREAQPVLGASVGRPDEQEQAPREPLPALEHGVELRGARKPPATAVARARGCRSHEGASPGSGRDPLAALLASALQHQLASLGPHADQEAMRALALAVVGLERPLHRESSVIGRASSGGRAAWRPNSKLYRPPAWPVNLARLASGVVLVPAADAVIPSSGFRDVASSAPPACLPRPPFPQLLKSLCKRDTVLRPTSLALSSWF
jgi:hypothetical protein